MATAPAPVPFNLDSIDIRRALDLLRQIDGLGSRSSVYADLLSGYNHRGTGHLAIPLHTESTGMTFFTRPNMNLSGGNLSMERILTPLLTNNQMTYQRAIRAMLDPRSNVFDIAQPPRNIVTPLFDEKQAFMPILTNGLKTQSGWPDQVMDYYTSKEGVMKENFSIPDGTFRTESVFDLSVSFRNYQGDPISLLLLVWLIYMSHIKRGYMVPYMENIQTNRADFQCRIFRFKLDTYRVRISKWASTTGCTPSANPIGAAMNFDDSDPYSHDNSDQISTSFHCHGAEYMDPLILVEFNEVVQLFNPQMADDTRDSLYVKIPYDELAMHNYKGYPHINVDTQELEWYVENTQYTAFQTAAQPYTKKAPALPNTTITPATPATELTSVGWASALTDFSQNIVSAPKDPSGSDTGSTT